MLKKIFSLMMAVVLVVGLLPTVALADESSNANDNAEIATEVENCVGNISVDMPSEILEDTPLSAVPLADDDIDSGTIGTCTWVIDANGCLTISPTNGVSGSFTKTSPSENSWPWYANSTKITSAKIESGVSTSESLRYFFSGCTRLTTVDLSDFFAYWVHNMNYMFYGCTSLETVDLSGVTTYYVNNMNYMFYGCSSLKTVDLSNLDTQGLDMSYMFYDCTSLESVDLPNSRASDVNMRYTFYNCSSLETVDLSGLDTRSVTNMNSMFYNCSSLETVDLSGLNTSSVTDMNSMFYNCSSLETLDLSRLDTSSVTNMSSMFYDCTSLESVDLSGLNASHVTDMDSMFYDCTSLESVDLSGLDISNLGSMYRMFRGCSSLESISLSGLDASSVTDMGSMFYDCSSLESIDLSGFDTSSVTNMGSIFRGCSSLETPNLSGLDTSSVTNMSSMFYNCTSLTTLDLSGFDTTSVTSMGNMFYNCSNLRTIIVGEKFTLTSSFPTPIKDGEKGKWMSDDGTVYDSPSDIPNNVAATYTAVFPASKTTLEATIKTAEALNSANYTSDSWAVLESALSTAIDLLADIYATQDEIDIANTNLQKAIDDLVYIVNTSTLESAIKTAESLNSTDYTAGSWTVLQLTLSYAKIVLADIASTQEEVDAASEALNIAIDGLKTTNSGVTVDKSALETAISAAEQLNSSEYTESSWSLLEAALTLAKSVLDNTSATQDVIDSTTDALNSAIAALVPVTSDTADKTELEMTIKAAAQLDKSEYTSDSWAALQDVLQAAQRIDADNAASQAEVNEVTDALLAAIDALQKLFVDVSDPSTYYYEYVYYMAELGIITGYNETTFGVGDPMTRAQLVTIMWRYCEPDEYANYNEATAKNTSGLPDVPDGMYYTGAVNWAVSEGVVTGNQLADGSYVFSPDNNISFEQMVTIVARYVLGFNGAEKYDTSALNNGAFTDAATVSNYARGSVAWAIENGVVTGNQNTDGTYTIAPLEDVARERAATVLARAIQEGLITERPATPTQGELNALSKAQGYLRSSSFSYSGLIKQLEYEGFTVEEATYGADNCGADWNEQALNKAKSYLFSQAFSYSGLIDQLEFEGFTTEEATYGVDNCGADWFEQAAKKAESYMRSISFSREGLISQLEYEGFTHEQAEYGATAVGL